MINSTKVATFFILKILLFIFQKEIFILQTQSNNLFILNFFMSGQSFFSSNIGIHNLKILI